MAKEKMGANQCPKGNSERLRESQFIIIAIQWPLTYNERLAVYFWTLVLFFIGSIPDWGWTPEWLSFSSNFWYIFLLNQFSFFWFFFLIQHTLVMVPLNTSLERLVRAVSALGAFAFISISLITPQADAAVYPPEISYIGIVRDFSMMASDFEVPTESSVAQRNLLAANLEGFPDLAVPVFVPYRLRGTTGYPLLSTGGPPSALAIANYGQMYFDEWYRYGPITSLFRSF